MFSKYPHHMHILHKWVDTVAAVCAAPGAGENVELIRTLCVPSEVLLVLVSKSGEGLPLAPLLLLLTTPLLLNMLVILLVLLLVAVLLIGTGLIDLETALLALAFAFITFVLLLEAVPTLLLLLRTLALKMALPLELDTLRLTTTPSLALSTLLLRDCTVGSE